MSIGMITAYVLNILLSFTMFDSTTLVASYDLNPGSIALGISLGILIPLISNIAPIMRALGKTLRDSLNIYHRIISDVTVKIIRLAEYGMSLPQFVVAVFLVVAGFMTYYLAPYAFIFQKLSIFLYIMNIILILMILGLTFLINLLQPYLEKIILKLILNIGFRKDKILHDVINKNFDSHQRRNTKTALMFSIALAFLIYGGTGFSLQINVIMDTVKLTLGSDIAVITLNPTNNPYYLNETALRGFFADYNKKFPNNMRAFTFVGTPLQRNFDTGSTIISSLAEWPTVKTRIVPVEFDFFDAVYDEFYQPTLFDKSINYPNLNYDSNKYDGVKGLYDRSGLIDLNSYDPYNIVSDNNYRKIINLTSYYAPKAVNLLVTDGIKPYLSIDVGNTILLNMMSYTFRCQIRSSAIMIPGFIFSGYAQIAKFSTTLVSMSDYQYIRDFMWNSSTTNITKYQNLIPPGSSYNIGKTNLLVRLDRDLSDDERLVLCNGIDNFIDNDLTFVIDVVDTVNTTKKVTFFINIFYLFIAFIAIVLSFFLILVSFVSNIKENAWEFGILRAIGLNKKQMTKIYIFEAVSLTLAAGLLGAAVGIFVAITTTLQFNLFTQLPFKFLFPTAVFVFTFSSALITSIWGSKVAIDEIKDKEISHIIRALE